MGGFDPAIQISTWATITPCFEIQGYSVQKEKKAVCREGELKIQKIKIKHTCTFCLITKWKCFMLNWLVEEVIWGPLFPPRSVKISVKSNESKGPHVSAGPKTKWPSEHETSGLLEFGRM